MAPQERQSYTTLKERLLKEFYRFSFYRAVHLLELLSPDKKPVGKTLVPGHEAVRFSVKPGLTFPPSDIASLEERDSEGRVDMEVAFMGLIGPAGVLPHWFNELAMERLRKKDSSLTSFYDIFHHRLISLFYLGWKKNRFPENYLPGGKDKLSNYLLSVAGLGTPGLTEAMALPAECLIFYSGLLSRTVPSAVAIESAVEYFSDAAVKVEQFIERLIPLSIEDQTRIGMANGELGINAVCGSRVWESQTKFKVNLGPLGYDQFLQFLPCGEMLHPIFSLVRYMVGIEYEFEIGLFLKRDEIPRCTLGPETPTSPRLGWSAWVKTPEVIPTEDPYVSFQEPARIS